MDDLEKLQSQFNAEGVIRWERGQGGLTRAVVTTPAAEAHVYLHGAHVTHYQPSGQEPVLFMSGKSWFEAGKPIRGGVPVIFPWFGASATNPQAPAHGFARTAPWTVSAATRLGDSIVLSLQLRSDDGSKKWWAFDFAADYHVSIGPSLDLSLTIRNTSTVSFQFEEALHTYLAVGDAREVSITGLAGREYLDKVGGVQEKTQGPAPIRFDSETDRVYLNTTGGVTLEDPSKHRRVAVSKEGSATTVVWNPWINKARAMPDFGDDEWRQMACIETANAAENAIELAPGASHQMRANIRHL